MKINIKLPFLKESSLLGVDIGNKNIKIVELAYIDNKYKIVCADKETILKDMSKEISPLEKRELTIEALKRVIQRNKIKSKKTAIGVSGNSVISRFVHLPKMSPQELENGIEYEAEPFIPFDISEVQLSFEILKDIVENNQTKMQTLLVAAKKIAIEEKIDIVKSAGLRPIVIDLDSFALNHIIGINKDLTNATIMCINIGAIITNMVIIEKNIPKVVRDITVGGNDFTNALQLSTSMDYNEAEKEKVSIKSMNNDINNPDTPDNADNPVNVVNDIENNIEHEEQKQYNSDVFLPTTRELIDEIQRSINYFQAQTGEIDVCHIYLTGGSAKLNGLDKYLTTELDIPVEIFNPFDFMETVTGKEFLSKIKSQGNMFAVAAGLALRKI